MDNANTTMAGSSAPESLPCPIVCAGGDVYSVNPAATVMDCHDQLDARLSQLTTMLSLITTGHGYEGFSEQDEKMQQRYLWSCYSLAQECEGLSLLMSRINRKPAPGGCHG